MSDRRVLIVNADDFGLSPGVNRGIIQAHEQGIVTSAGLMVRMPAAREAAEYARRHPALSLGLHLDLGEWVYRDGEWSLLYEVVPADDEAAVREEIDRQLAAFEALVGRQPTHLDSHQHVHRHAPVRGVVEQVARRLHVPVREMTPGVRYEGAFYGQDGRGEPFPDGVGLSNLIRLVRGLAPGITELGCHPGFDDGLTTMYRLERSREVAALCDPSLREVIAQEGIALLSFHSEAVKALGNVRDECDV